MSFYEKLCIIYINNKRSIENERKLRGEVVSNDILNIKDCKKIAIMGGTFDPIHYGHLVAAEAVRAEINPQKVVFIPSGRPPHKKENNVSLNEHRYLMCVLATVTNPCFDVSRIEIDRPGFTYTIDTIKEIKKDLPSDAEIYFITGADALNQILTWKDAETLLTSCKFVAVTRPGYKKDALLENISAMREKFDISLQFIEIPALAISSTDIRKRVSENKPIKYLLPESVEEYILKFGLYSKNTESTFNNLAFIKKRMHETLSTQRFLHTLGVCEEAENLALHYGEDASKAYLAALLHDCAKDFSDKEKIKLCKEYGIELDVVLKKQIDLVHSFLGAEMARCEYDIVDKDIINAIRYHTTGRKNMSKLEKIIYIADAIEPYRKNYEGLEKIRSLAYSDLDEAMKFSLKSTIDFNTQKERVIHPLSIQALEFLQKNT